MQLISTLPQYCQPRMKKLLGDLLRPLLEGTPLMMGRVY